MKPYYPFSLIFLFIIACQPTLEKQSFPAPEASSSIREGQVPEGLTREIYQDKLLGMLIGSAIGDAMGAPVEMWSRDWMQAQYGYVDTLVHVIREGSPEGPWEDNMMPGATTDDTRWKYLMGQYLLTQDDQTLDDVAFANYLVSLYEEEKQEVQSLETFDPEPLEQQLRHMTWLQEWAKVAHPFAEDDLQGYSYALNRFYGGEMSCAGMLYTPMIGAYLPGQPVTAYEEAYRLGIFDLGYARDISALSAGYVAQAMKLNSPYDSIAGITPVLDPLKYANSRLIGRLAQQSYFNARKIVYDARSIIEADPKLRIPKGFKRSALEFTQMTQAFQALDQQMQQIPFHAGEIHLINLTALLYSEGDFRLAMEFIVNFGRDNDTVAAVTGAILGAYVGYENLPKGLALPVLKTSKETIGIDLEALSQQLTDKLFGNEEVNN
ncbi:MAG: ADP-ribosylglycohydrolase family protein [Cytophagales bacterium]|nr:ADP-ribosylglycohydrolase family protein [Cytophagales bacterium]